MEKSKKKLVGNLFLNNIYQLLILVVPLVITPYIARVLGADGVGVSSYVISLVTYFTLLAGLGTTSYGTREIARCRDNKKEYSKNFWEIEIVSIFSSILSISLWLVLSFAYHKYTYYLLILTILILATCLNISWFYAGLEKFKYSIIINIICKISGIFFVFFMVKKPEDVGIYLIIKTLIELISNLSMWLFLPKFICETKVDLHSIKNHFKQTMVYFVPAIATSIYTVLDKSLIGIITQDASQNGYYEQATKIINIVQTISFYGINGVMMSRSSYLFVENNKQKIRKNIINTFDINLSIAIPAVFGLIGISNIFVPWFFGPGYNETIKLIYILSAIISILLISNTIGSLYYTPAGKIKKSTNYLIIGSVTNLIFNLCLIPFLGAYGAAISSIIAELIITILYLCNCDGIIKIKDIIKLSYKRIIAASVMLIYVILCNMFINTSAFCLLIIDVLGAVIIYGIMLIILKDSLIITILKNIWHK